MKMCNIDIKHYFNITPTPEFQISHYKERSWVSDVLEGCSNKEKAFKKWMNRDILFADEVREPVSYTHLDVYKRQMYAKLAFKNIRRSLRDYIIYFVTITLTAALMYVFLALGFSQDIIAMSENMSMLTSGILILSVLIAFMTSFVIGYAIRFMLGQRKKELATYELMGMRCV